MRTKTPPPPTTSHPAPSAFLVPDPCSLIPVLCVLAATLLLNGCSKKPAPNTPPANQQTAGQSGQQPDQQPQGALNSDGTYSPAPNPAPNSTPAPVSSPAAANQPPAQPPAPPSATAGNTSTATPTAEPVTLPHGTPITIRITERLSASHNEIGDRFTGVLSAPILSHHAVVFPVGTHVSGTVIAVRGRGTFSGSGALGIRLTTLAGHPVHATEFEQIGKGNGKHTAGFIGGGAGLGAILGAVAGGGKGALIGGAVGAGAGTAGAAFTGKHDVIIPSETRVTFRLTQPFTLP
jgi:hypothetical protein